MRVKLLGLLLDHTSTKPNVCAAEAPLETIDPHTLDKKPDTSSINTNCIKLLKTLASFGSVHSAISGVPTRATELLHQQLQWYLSLFSISIWHYMYVTVFPFE